MPTVRYMGDAPKGEEFDPGGELYGFLPVSAEIVPLSVLTRIKLLADAFMDGEKNEDETLPLIIGCLPDGRLAIVGKEMFPRAKYVIEEKS